MKFILLVLVFLVTPVYSQEIQRVTLPLEVRNEIVEISPDLEGKVWNRWTSENFTVLSLDNDYAQFLHSHLEQVKSWVFSRWGLEDHSFSAECKIICVSDVKLFEEMFKIKQTVVEVRRNSDGTIKESVVFILADKPPSQTVPMAISEVCISEFAQQNNIVLRKWMLRGMSLLGGSFDQIKTTVQGVKNSLEKDQPMFFSENLNQLDDLKTLTDEQKSLFDQSSMALCLMIRKEFGQDVFHQVMVNKEPFYKVLGFDSFDRFDLTFKRYLTDITNELSNDKMPMSYLQINAK